MKRYTQLLRPLFIIMALGVASPIAHAQISDSTGWQPGPVPDADSAIKIALAFTGFDKTEEFSANKIQTPRRVLAEQDTAISILHWLINGKSAWAVMIQGLAIGRQAVGGSALQENLFDVTVFIESETGGLLKVILTNRAHLQDQGDDLWEGLVPVFSAGSSKAIRLPQTLPDLDCLHILLLDSIRFVYSPIEIVAYYLLTVPDTEGQALAPTADGEQSIWFVTTKGRQTHPRHPDRGEVPLIEWHSLDAVTGSTVGLHGYTAGQRR